MDAAIEAVREAAAQGAVMCAAAEVGRADGTRARGAFGRLAPDDTSGPSADTLFDMASLTKVMVTAPLLTLFAQSGRLKLSDHAGEYLPRFKDKGAGFTLSRLATHTAGLPAHVPLHKQCRGVAEAVEAIAGLPLDYAIGGRVVYSDLGFILLGAVLELIGGEPLDALFTRHVAKPLGMGRAAFRPSGGALADVAATEYDPAEAKCLRGVVHDENARALGGVCGHAGLFASLGDAARYAAALLTGRDAEGAEFFSAESLAALSRSRTKGLAGPGRGVGFMVNDPPASGFAATETAASTRMSGRAFGHTGFTGTSLWVDPAAGAYFVLLTNRVCPSRDNAHIFALRRAFHDAFYTRGVG